MADDTVSEEVTAPKEKRTNTAEYGCIKDLAKQQAETADPVEETTKSAAKTSTTSNKG